MKLTDKFKQYLKKNNQTTTNNRKKVGIILFATSIGLFFLFVTRLSYIVIVGDVAGTSLAEKTKNLYEGSEVIKAKRGTIYDRNGIPIAEDVTSYSIYAVLNQNYKDGKKNLFAEKANFNKLGKILSDVLSIDQETAVNTLEEGLEQQLWRVSFGSKGNNITLEQKNAIEDAMEKEGIAGFHFDSHPARLYPNGVFSSHFIGYAVANDDDTGLVGKTGLEAAYNDVLSGTDGEIVYQKDNNQNPLPGTVAETVAAVDGKDVYTTIDSRIQSYLETLMDSVFKENKPENLTANLMDAKTGEIVAMAQRPTYNPENLDSINDWQNLLVEDNYEPGSTMKILTTAAAIDQGIFNENETFTPSPDGMKLYDATINDWDFGQKGTLTMRQALSWSSNIGMVTLEQRMADRWQQYLKEFGFGRSTYSGLPNENTGITPEDNPVSQAMTSFGQAIGVTNFQMMQAFTSVANNGTMLKPQFISKIVDGNTGEETVTQPEEVGHPITEEAATKVREYMRDVVESENYGSAYGVYELPGYNISAKTGTAQVADPTTGKYLSGGTNYLYSVVLMFPSEEPEYILYLTIKLPEKHESTVLGEIANPLMKRVMDLKNSALEDSTTSGSETTVGDYRNLDTESAATDVQKAGLTPVVIGDGEKVIAQSVDSGTSIMPGGRVLLITDSDKYYMPDTTSWSKADLIKFGSLLNVDVSFEGDGYCTKQSVEPYTELSGQSIKFTLSENE
ncbi:penicillin-binding transpeptidase domain-containing protein [Enterococcus casseliflavus]|uniref:penicillin-binding transpeptidase domain-containing protein n=1 Tax=Enterococcus casseliflavus TaxID=37734 RepID=UPI000EB22502|nr:penicillin-binding transpeptidase domain-containing protein [Enterococcus casseliflavus]AYJ45114.1 penicillin-binding protein [Enterococcus casseliflavus]MCD4961781.1 penicillin-binding protein [Enterococcus casseliflavus]MDB1696912.1 penicillin-binding transpeptidase domain-containing protein [Enterococcus casseliflavus]MDB1700342.1 penicillin-binding transpeptidase domain-containing protein [Enterococcus casseliflavus]MDB1703470.1 penicillin-binding transpeptidase domain-containing protei